MSLEQSKRVLVVEDQDNIRYALEKFLEDAGYHVDASVTSDDAYQRLQTGESPHLIISDIHQLNSRMDGLNLCERLKSERPDIKFVIISGSWDQEIQDQAHQLGVAKVIEKPIAKVNFLREVEKIIGPAKKSEPAVGTSPDLAPS